MAYTTKAKIQNYLAIDIDSSLDSQLSSWITAATNYIDNYTGKSFEQSASGVRYYDGNGKREIDIDDFISLSAVEILEINSGDVQFSLVEGQGEDYITYPYNTENKYRLILTTESKVAVWSNGVKRIKITGVWGQSSAVPEDVSLVATMLVAGIIEKGLKGGSVSSESLGDYSISYNNIDALSTVMGAKEILSKYKIWEL